jgi:pimeloyl-ACP methyl ester carboxylesterase
MPDHGPRLAGIDVPVGLVAGERDAKFRALAEAMAEGLPRGRLHVVPDAGHNVVLEQPAEIARLLQELDE